MTGSQYKNIIQWTLHFEENQTYDDSLIIARIILKNLGVAFPKGNYDDIILILKHSTYLGWTPCSCEEAQRFADLGVASIAIDSTKIIIILPDENISNLSDISTLNENTTDVVKHTSEITPEECEKMQFFTYSYGFVLE